MIHKGTLFWYKSRGKKYAALVLDEIGHGDYYLVLLSEEINCSETFDEIMELPTYTAAWFCRLLPSFRIHIITKDIPLDNFNGYAGGFFSDKKVIINNCGQSKTWKHKLRQISFNGRKMKEQMMHSSYNSIGRISP